MLTKSEIKQITKSISDMPRDSLMQCVEMNLKKHIKCEEKLLDALLQNKSLFQLLIVYHQTTFITLYNQFCKGKEKYLRFQVEWYKHCSIFFCPVSVNQKMVKVLTQMRSVMLNKLGRHFVTHIRRT